MSNKLKEFGQQSIEDRNRKKKPVINGIVPFIRQSKNQSLVINLAGVFTSLLALTIGLVINIAFIYIAILTIAPLIFALFISLLYLINSNLSNVDETKIYLSEIYYKLNQISSNNGQPINSNKINSKLSKGSFELYLRYQSLAVSDLASILRVIDNFYKVIYGIINVCENREWVPEIEDPNIDNIDKDLISFFYKLVDAKIRINPDDRLEIESIQTGNSIRINFNTPFLKFKISQKPDSEDPNNRKWALLGKIVIITQLLFLTTGSVRNVIEIAESENPIVQYDHVKPSNPCEIRHEG